MNEAEMMKLVRKHYKKDLPEETLRTLTHLHLDDYECGDTSFVDQVRAQ